MFVNEGYRLAGFSSLAPTSGPGLSKLELLFVNTADYRCQVTSPALSYNITRLFVDLDSD